MFLKVSQNTHASVGVSFFDKFTDWTMAALLERDSSTGNSCEFCNILQSITFKEMAQEYLLYFAENISGMNLF